MDDDGVDHKKLARQNGPKGSGLQFGDMEAIDMADGKADGMAVDKKDAGDADDSADHHNMTGVGAKDGKVGGLTMEELIMEQEMAIEAEAELSEMADGKADDKAAGKESANGVSADKNALGAECDMGGELTAGDRTKEYEAALNQANAAVRQAPKDAPFIQPPPPRREDHVAAHVATGAEGGAPARRGEPSVSLNSLNSSSGKEGVSSSGSANPALDPALDKKDADGADVATGVDDEDDDEVIHRGRGRKLLLDSDDDEGSGVKSGVQTGGKTAAAAARKSKSKKRRQTPEAESASHAIHAGHCATLNIAHGAS